MLARPSTDNFDHKLIVKILMYLKLWDLPSVQCDLRTPLSFSVPQPPTH